MQITEAASFCKALVVNALHSTVAKEVDGTGVPKAQFPLAAPPFNAVDATHVGPDEKVPAAKFTVYVPVDEKVILEIPGVLVANAQVPVVQTEDIVARSIRSDPVELLETDPTKRGTGMLWVTSITLQLTALEAADVKVIDPLDALA